MRPPIPNSYWVIPGKLLAGEHPSGPGRAETGERLAQIVEAGVRRFVDLTQPGEMPDYQPQLPGGAAYRRFPVRDHAVPESEAQMRAIVATIEDGITSGDAVYLHCRAGIGRTGTAAGCLLVERGASPEAALEHLNRAWQQSQRSASWPSVPETGAQHDFVLAWRPSKPAAAGPAIPESPLQQAARSRHRACLVGLALGDIAAQPGEPAGIRRWTDETAMAICAADSLLERQGFDGRDLLERLRRWGQDPEADGAAAGSALRPVVQEALKRALRNPGQLAGSHDPALIDPSPLARCAAPALFATRDPLRAIALGGDIARVTHQAPLVVDTCRLFTGMIAVVLGGRSREAMLGVATLDSGIPLRDEVAAVARAWSEPPGGRRTRPPGILGCLDQAVRALLRTQTFEEGLARLIDGAGRDPDATLAAYGALAGALYGEAGLPAARRRHLVEAGRLERLADRLFATGRVR